MYSRFFDEALCAKEFSGMAAVAITETNGWDDTLTDANGEVVPYYKQGLAVTRETACDETSEMTDDFCMAVGADDSQIPAFYADKGLPADNKYVPRGAGYMYGVDEYYWFSQVVYGDNTIIDDLDLVSTDPVNWWLSGLMKWMIPMNGKPSPHNIIMGQWEPTDAELELGITDGFGAISSLFYGGEQCGMSGHPRANARTEIYENLMAGFSGDGWTAMDTVFDWESSDCASAAREDFPTWGDYNFPMFAQHTIDAYETPTCFVVSDRTDYILWAKDGFRDCIMAALAL